MKRILIFLFFCGMNTCLYSQNMEKEIDWFMETHTNLVWPFSQEVEVLEQRIRELVKRSSSISHFQNVRQYHIFNLVIVSKLLWTDDYLSGKFLNSLSPKYYQIPVRPKKNEYKPYLDAITIVSDSAGNLIAEGDARLLMTYPPHNKDIATENLLRIFEHGDIDFAFYQDLSPLTMICIKDKKLFVLKQNGDIFDRVPWRTYIQQDANK